MFRHIDDVETQDTNQLQGGVVTTSSFTKLKWLVTLG